jgi:S1-C subfamily serine protease
MFFPRHIPAVTCLFLAIAVIARCQNSLAQDAPASDPATIDGATIDPATIDRAGATSRPLLEELNHETQTLFKQVSSSIVRVQLPSGVSVAASGADPLAKYQMIDPSVRHKLEEMLRNAPENVFVRAEIRPSTAASTSPGQTSIADGQQTIVLQLTRFMPNSMGVILDDEQHILVSHFVDKNSVGGPIPLVLADGRFAAATFVASDRPSDLTVLQLQGVKGEPATFTDGKPRAGTFLLVMSLNPAMNRLTVWEGREPDLSALVTIDGKIAGFSKGNQFMSLAASKREVSDLIEHHFVQRAILGVTVEVVPPADPQRGTDEALGAAPALRVDNVIDGSPAQRAGLLKGDLILTFAGEPVGDLAGLATAIANRRGETEMVVLRNGVKQIVKAQLQVP